jgi:heme/copper-type cytochrome/quinol oxidase subunit 2/mono/diheme cytochrome c family protein
MFKGRLPVTDRPQAAGESASERGELLALVGLILILIVLPVTILGYQFIVRPKLAKVPIVDIVAAAPEAGGFQPDTIRVPAGEKLRLRFSAPDVTHGIAIGPGLGLDLGHLDPGEVREVEVAFDRPGRYTFYCNSWCSPNHWRMRGSIEVYDPQSPDAVLVSEIADPVLESLAARGVDIDAPHEASVVPRQQPSAARGAEIVARLGGDLPAELDDLAWRRTHSPVEAWTSLVEMGLSQPDAWDAVAYLWSAGPDVERRESAGRLYAKNCAACHGERGDGQGPGADALTEQGIGQHSGMSMAQAPAAFADPRTMLGGSGDVYYAKIRRGGMGTGMPSFGPIFTQEETWMLVEHLWTFVFPLASEVE